MKATPTAPAGNTVSKNNHMTLRTRGREMNRITNRGLGRTLFCLLAPGALALWILAGCDKSSPSAGHEHAHGEKDEHGHSEEGHGHEEPDAHDHDSHGKKGHEHSEDEHGHGHGEEEGGHSDEVTLTPEAITAAGIKVESVGKRNLAGIVTSPARIAFNAEAMAHIGTSLHGRVVEINVRLGDAIEKGGVVLVIDSPEFGEAQSEFLQRRSEVSVARTNVEVAKSAYDRAKRLVEGKGISEAEFLKREGEFKAAQGQVVAADSAAAGAKSKLRLLGMSQSETDRLVETGSINSRTLVRAPIPGKVIEREATLGEVVGPDSPPLMILADTSLLWVLADVPEGDVHKISVGALAKIRVPSLPEHNFEGKIEYIDPKINPQTRSAAVRIVVPGENTPLQPGMFGQAEIVGGFETSSEVLAVAQEAVQTVEGGPAVFVPVDGEANTFAKRSVAIGPAIGGWVPVLSGLQEGEQVVVAGSFVLKADLGKAGAAHEH